MTMTAVLFRRSILGKTGLFNTKAWMLGDAEWAYRACLVSDVVVVPEVLATWRRHTDQVTGKGRFYQRQATKWAYKVAKRVIYDARAGVPLVWQKVPDWQSVMLEKCRLRYWDSFKIYRWELKRRPFLFLQGLLAGICCAPRWVLIQIKNRFAQHPILSVAEEHHIRKLFTIFKPDWPPVPLEQHTHSRE